MYLFMWNGPLFSVIRVLAMVVLLLGVMTRYRLMFTPKAPYVLPGVSLVRCDMQATMGGIL